MVQAAATSDSIIKFSSAGGAARWRMASSVLREATPRIVADIKTIDDAARGQGEHGREQEVGREQE